MIDRQRIMVWFPVWLTAIASTVSGGSLLAQSKDPVPILITGRAVDSQGIPLRDATFVYGPRATLDVLAASNKARERSGADGRFYGLIWKARTDPWKSPIVTAPGREGRFMALAGAQPALFRGREVQRIDVGNVYLDPARKLSVLVQDADRRPVVGAQVGVRTAYATRNLGIRDRRQGHPSHSTAVTDRRGRAVIMSPEAGCSLWVTATGYFGWREEYLPGDAPVVVAMTKADRVKGSVVDKTGELQPVRQVMFQSEYASGQYPCPVDGNGRFDTFVPFPGRYRLEVFAWKATPKPRSVSIYSEVLEGPNRETKIVIPKLPTPSEVADVGGLRVRAVDAATGKPVEYFKARVRWTERAMLSQHLERLRSWLMFNAAGPDTDGVAHLPGPAPNEPESAFVLIGSKDHGMILPKLDCHVLVWSNVGQLKATRNGLANLPLAIDTIQADDSRNPVELRVDPAEIPSGNNR